MGLPGLTGLLALAPRSYPGIWELIIHRTATAPTAATLITGGASDALMVAAVDGALAILTVTAYLVARGYAGWTRFRSG